MSLHADRHPRSRSKAWTRAARKPRRAAAARGSRRAGRRVESLDFPDYDDAHRPGDLEGPARRARLRPGHDSAALHRQPPRVQAGDPGVARRRARGDLRPLHGVQRGVRRGAGPRRALARVDPGVPAAAGGDGPARHRPRGGGGAQGEGARQVRERSADARPRARRATCARRRTCRGWSSTRRGPSTWSRPTSLPPWPARLGLR